MRIKTLPRVLALHLKRFKFIERLQRHTKLSFRVVHPFELRLFNTVIPNNVSVAECVKIGFPVTVAFPHSTASAAYQQLLDEIDVATGRGAK